LLSITIIGFNLGFGAADVRKLTVKGAPCTSVVHTNIEYPIFNTGSASLTQITCLCGSPSVAGILASKNVTVGDVRITVPGGEASGREIHPVVSQAALSAMKSGSGGRPVIVELDMNAIPFRPHAIALRRLSSKTNKYLYWSNTADGASGIYRCRVDGSRIESVTMKVIT
jgi:hypothetical protein